MIKPITVSSITAIDKDSRERLPAAAFENNMCKDPHVCHRYKQPRRLPNLYASTCVRIRRKWLCMA